MRPRLQHSATSQSHELVEDDPESVDCFKIHVLVTRNLINAELIAGHKAHATRLKQAILSAIKNNLEDRTQFQRISSWLEVQSNSITEMGAMGGDNVPF